MPSVRLLGRHVESGAHVRCKKSHQETLRIVCFFTCCMHLMLQELKATQSITTKFQIKDDNPDVQESLKMGLKIVGEAAVTVMEAKLLHALESTGTSAEVKQQKIAKLVEKVTEQAKEFNIDMRKEIQKRIMIGGVEKMVSAPR